MQTASEIIEYFRKKQECERKEQLQSFYQYSGFNDLGETYVPTITTEDVIGRLKGIHCLYSKTLGYHSPFPIPGIEMEVVKDTEVVVYDDRWQRYRLDPIKCRECLMKIYDKHTSDYDKGNGFFGAVGDEIAVKVRYEKSIRFSVKSDFGGYYVVVFRDADNHLFTWFQRAYEESTIKDFVQEYGDTDGFIHLHGKIRTQETVRCCKYDRMISVSLIGADGTDLYDYAVKQQNSDCDNSMVVSEG